MEFLQSIKKPYQAVLDEKWEDMGKYYSDISEDPMGLGSLLCPISVDRDTAFHLAVYSGGKQPLARLLELVEKEGTDGILGLDEVFMENIYGNTVLHEAAISGNLEAVQILVSKLKKLLKDTNEFEETPLFRAAAFGKTKVVKYLASQPDQVVEKLNTDNGKKHLENIHRQRKDGASILHAAVQGEHFGTALELLELDEELANLKYNDGTSLYLLANIPYVFRSGRRTNIFEKLIYICLPIGKDHDDDSENIEYEVEVKSGERNGGLNKNGCISKGCPIVRKLWKEKRYQKFAYDLAKKLVEIDESWEQSITAGTTTQYVAAENKPNTNNGEEKEKEEKDQSPLFAATRTGNAELVKMILKEHPQALEYKNSKKQNILHVAVKYRQKEIFDYVITKKVPMLRLVRRIDAKGYTVLHSVADTKHYTISTRSGPAYKLQEELEWFSSVKKLIPSHYRMLRDNKNRTAKELFKRRHRQQLDNAQKWIKETSQSCSGVAVLVSTVVFAAAFTVPGGTNDSNGRPILLHSPFFLFFTVMDVVSLSCSLTAVVMFLSIVTSPFELDDFLVSLPRRLTLGFALLFMSVATTMLAFTSTIFLVIHLDHHRRQWTMTLICSAAFLPVSVLALTHFPLFVSFLKAWKNLFVVVWEALPCSIVLSWLKLFLGKSARPCSLVLRQLKLLGKSARGHLPFTYKGK
ncbi:hypothetical protein LWI28_022055 [Acer negundo]|uniref:PGG domain-containing protein n=1 Tax=Acer negundo TaxID=4023 RepID=A0AAD5IFU2_ACENE|nr:hypothetical protein LWI28_022055 [Acer negundo]